MFPAEYGLREVRPRHSENVGNDGGDDDNLRGSLDKVPISRTLFMMAGSLAALASTDTGFGAGVADPEHHDHRAFCCGQRERRDTAHRPGSGLETGWTGRLSSKIAAALEALSAPTWSRRLHPDGHTILASGALATAHSLYPKLPYDTLRDFVPVIPLGQQPMVLVTAPSKGFQDARRPDCRCQGEARRAEFCLRGNWLRVALCGRTSAPQRRIRGPAHTFQGRHGRIDGSPGGTSGLLLCPARAGARAHQRRQARRARGQHAQAGHGVAARADNDGSRICRLGLRVLGRPVPAGEDPARHRRQASQGNGDGAANVFRARAAGEARGSNRCR